MLVGRAAGRKAPAEISRTLKSACCIAVALSLAYIAVLAAFRREFLEAFLSKDGGKIDLPAYFSAGNRIILMLSLRTGAEFLMFIFMFAMRGIGRTQTIFKIGLVISAAVWLPGLALVTACHPSAPAYWFILALTSAVGCAIYYASLRRQTTIWSPARNGSR